MQLGEEVISQQKRMKCKETQRNPIKYTEVLLHLSFNYEDAMEDTLYCRIAEKLQEHPKPERFTSAVLISQRIISGVQMGGVDQHLQRMGVLTRLVHQMEP